MPIFVDVTTTAVQPLGVAGSASTWTVSATDVITKALRICGIIGAGQTASAQDYSVCMDALQDIIKEMPLHGLSWPKITPDPVALTWDNANPVQVSMPADYFGVPVVSFIRDSVNVDLHVIPKATYDALPNPMQTAPYPSSIYIAPNNVGYLWPVPTLDPELIMTYQALTLDASIAAIPDVAQSWMAGLSLWLANEVAPIFGLPLADRQDIERRFMMRRGLMLSYAVETAPIVFGVVD